jgi:hypothetical protein
MSDLRNDLAKARDIWLDSDEGIRCIEGSATGRYLQNRVEHAFVSGWNANTRAIDVAAVRKVIIDHVNDLRRCVVVLSDYPQLLALSDEISRASDELLAAIGESK